MSITLNAEARTSSGKGDTRKLRAAGRLPAVMYGSGSEAKALTVDPREFGDIFRKSGNRNTILNVTLDGKQTPCLVREAQRHPLSREILHVDLYEVPSDRDVTVMVPVTTSGIAEGAQAGGRIRIIRRELPVSCRYDAIPESIVVDVTALDLGDMISTDAISMAEGSSIAVDVPIFVVTCYGRRASKADDEEVEE